jgi:hypothetical protein
MVSSLEPVRTIQLLQRLLFAVQHNLMFDLEVVRVYADRLDQLENLAASLAS